jgi:hypothetical protein
MNWILPVPLLLLAGVVALLPLAACARCQGSLLLRPV